jgi:signal transduction histidine kinase/ActR/RegA family two-component response regulator
LDVFSGTGAINAITDHCVGPDRERYIAVNRRSSETGEPYEIEYRLRSFRGDIRTVRETGRYTRNAEGRVDRAYGAVTDITELSETQHALERARDAAEKANEAKSVFLATMSHEIRTPMNGIMGMAHLLSGTTLDAEQRDFVTTILRSSESLLSIINDILDFSKIESGRFEIDAAAFELQGTVMAVTNLVKPLAAAKKIKLTCSMSPESAIWVMGDAGRLRQVLLNLLNNAVKFTETGTVDLTITAEEQPAAISFVVKDTGIGIAADRLDRLFKPFSQVDSTTTRRYGGTGLGLAISQNLVRLMGGDITVDSAPGKGSRFSFTLPLQVVAAPETSPAPPATQSIEPDIVASVPLQILMVDDHPTNRKFGAALLKRLGYACDVVGSGQEAIAACAKTTYDVIYMDIEMPDIDGIVTTRVLRETYTSQKLHVVAITANALAGDREKYLVAGFDDYVSKPIRIEEMVRSLKVASDKVAS